MKTICLPRALKWFLITVAGLLGVVVLSPLIPGLDALLSTCIRLAVGWIVFLVDTAPKIQFNPLSIFNGLLAVTLGTWVLHGVLKFVYRHLREDLGLWRWKWTLAGPAMLAMLFGICVSATGVVTQTSELFQAPLRQISIRGSEVRDTLNANILRTRIRTSAPDNLEKKSSENWSAVFALIPEDTEDLAQRAIILTAAKLDAPEVWTCLGGLDESFDADLPIICAPRAYSKKGRIVAFADGRPRFCSQQEYEEAIVRWHAARAKLRLDGRKQNP